MPVLILALMAVNSRLLGLEIMSILDLEQKLSVKLTSEMEL